MRITKIKLFAIIILPLVIFVGLGGFGYGIDVHQSYIYAKNWTVPNVEFLGWYLSSVNLNDIFLGSIIVSFLLYIAHFSLVREQELILFEKVIVLYVLLFSFWAIMLQLNVLRQGLAYGFFVLFAVKWLSKSKIAIFYAPLAITSHFSVALPLFFILFVRAHPILHTMVIFLFIGMAYFTGLSDIKSSIPTSMPYKFLLYLMIAITLPLYLNRKKYEYSGYYFPFLTTLASFDESQLQRLLFYVYPFVLLDVVRLFDLRSRKAIIVLMMFSSFAATYVLSQRMLF